MSLVEYRRKRQFDKTREPAPGKPLPEGKRAIFVVQLHHASRRHYDFRLQVGDALKSWAVPKGPSYDPDGQAHGGGGRGPSAVATPTFEGDIPKGEYGGGHVALFDQGVWSTPYDAEAQLAKGHLRFELFGEKLKGGWHLVRSRQAGEAAAVVAVQGRGRVRRHVEADDLLADVTRAAGGRRQARRARQGRQEEARDRRAEAQAATHRLGRKGREAARREKATLQNEAFAPQLAQARRRAARRRAVAARSEVGRLSAGDHDRRRQGAHLVAQRDRMDRQGAGDRAAIAAARREERARSTAN